MLNTLNITKHDPWYAGQFGVPGSISALGVKVAPTGLTYYVDANHPDANDNNDGLNPKSPFLTIGAAVAAVANEGDQILIFPGEYSESVVTPDSAEGPNYVNIIGMNVNQMAVQWDSGAAASPCLDIRAIGWTVENIKFACPATNAGVVLRYTDTGANDIAAYTVLRGCKFDGLTTGLYGVHSHGAYSVLIEDCIFERLNNVGNTSTGLFTGAIALAIPFRNIIRNCVFQENDNHIDFTADGSIFVNNIFTPGSVTSPVVTIRTNQAANPGDDNIVTGNYFPGDYSNTGGYYAGAADEWVGNVASDTAEAEVGDNGFTIARPAA